MKQAFKLPVTFAERVRILVKCYEDAKVPLNQATRDLVQEHLSREAVDLVFQGVSALEQSKRAAALVLWAKRQVTAKESL